VANVLCVLYEDPVTGYPPAYGRETVPTIGGYPDGQSAPDPERVDFTPGELLGSSACVRSSRTRGTRSS